MWRTKCLFLVRRRNFFIIYFFLNILRGQRRRNQEWKAKNIKIKEEKCFFFFWKIVCSHSSFLLIKNLFKGIFHFFFCKKFFSYVRRRGTKQYRENIIAWMTSWLWMDDVMDPIVYYKHKRNESSECNLGIYIYY